MTFTMVAMPAYNEGHVIADVIQGCKKYVDNIFVVDDGSLDNTAEVAESMGAFVERHKENKGYGAALKSCFRLAREFNADAMVIIDADGQHNPDDIPKLLEPLEHDVDIVIGSRFVNGNGKNVPKYRKIGMKFLDSATNLATGLDVTDSQSGFRAYGKKAIENIRIREDNMSAGSEILLQVKDHNLKFTEVEINCRYDIEQCSSQNPLVHGSTVMLNILHSMNTRRPLYYFTVPGIMLTTIGIFMGIILLRYLNLVGTLGLESTFLFILVILVGIFLTFTGIILDSFSKMICQLQEGGD